MSRNPPWNRDELILALDLYFQLDFGVSSGRYGPNSPEIRSLSDSLNRLPLVQRVNEDFRNPNGVSMTLRTFLRFDDAYGGKGLSRGNKLEESVWVEFHSVPSRLRETAEAIVQNAMVNKKRPEVDDTVNELTGAYEGSILWLAHRRRERSAKLRKAKISQVLTAQGQLPCEACGMTFESVYGDLGRNFIEVHHRVPLAKLRPDSKTYLRDLALLCSNCHRMIHRAGNDMDIGNLVPRLAHSFNTIPS